MLPHNWLSVVMRGFSAGLVLSGCPNRTKGWLRESIRRLYLENQMQTAGERSETIKSLWLIFQQSYILAILEGLRTEKFGSYVTARLSCFHRRQTDATLFRLIAIPTKSSRHQCTFMAFYVENIFQENPSLRSPYFWLSTAACISSMVPTYLLVTIVRLFTP